MRVALIVSVLLFLIVGTGFYAGMHVASFTGHVVSDEYRVFDSVTSNAGTKARIVSIVGGDERVLITLEVQDLVLREHSMTFVSVFSVAGEEVGRATEEVLVPYSAITLVALSVPVRPLTGQEATLRIEGTDDLGTLYIEGTTSLTVTSVSYTRLWWGFGGFFVLLVLIFLVVRHLLTRANVASFAQVHSDGLIHLR
ncbi:hypothetical protein EXS73_01340 [Candidatus Pacearchaeota archaeon]|nr:hypothetical protein [Candidatus Pacearchaeota archaeon]